MIIHNIARKAYKRSIELDDDVVKNSHSIQEIKDEISSIHTHTHSNKQVLDQTTASYLLEEKQKLSGIEAGANKNKQSNWNEQDELSDEFIKNKPVIPQNLSQLSNDVGFITANDLPSVDDSLSNQSTNAVQNKVITSALNGEASLRENLEIALNQTIQKINLIPADNKIVFSGTPTSSTTLFTAPSNGVCYLRYSLRGNGYIGFHLRSNLGQDLAYNTQYCGGNGFIYNATFVMKKGQKIYCYENALTVNWGDAVFVPAESV